MPKITIDGQLLEVAPGTTVMQAAESIGIQIPHFCYHDKLSAPANCRMCLVEIEKIPKPVPSCAQPCMEGMVVRTETPALVAARKSVMESLLVNHPLDCPVCDQGGECDLQDQAMAFGGDRSRFHEEKRLVSEKELGPLVKTVMTRCIHCTRCIRFLDEVAGTPELAKIERGERTEITNLDGLPLTSELSGNLIDVCPVGALTAKPYAFKGRSWEMKPTESVDVTDAVGSAIRIDTRRGEIMRILPRRNDAINEEWISDKARFAFDGLKVQRLDKPYIRENGRLRPATWDEAFEVIAKRLAKIAPEQVAAIAGDQADGESLFALKSLMGAIGSPHLDCRQDGADYDRPTRASYIMNSTIAGLEQADAVLLIGTDPRREAPLINARIRKTWRQKNIPIGLVGRPTNLTYPAQMLGAKPQILQEILGGNHPFVRCLSGEHPALILGAGALARADGPVLHRLAAEIAEKYSLVRENWNGFNLLQTAASRVAGLDMGFVPQAYGWATRAIFGAAAAGQLDTVFLLGADEMDMAALGGAFVVYIGHHGDYGAHRADVVLPGAAYTEKSGLFVNTEGRAQRTTAALPPPGEARPDGQLILDLAKALGKSLPFGDTAALRAAMEKAVPAFARLGDIEKAAWAMPKAEGKILAHPFDRPIANFYMTDPICRASATMAKCVAEILPHQAGEEG